MVPWMVAVEGLVLVEKVTFSDLTTSISPSRCDIYGITCQSTINICILQIKHLLPLMMSVWQLLSAIFPKRSLIDQQVAMREDEVAPLECRMHSWLTIQCTRHL